MAICIKNKSGEIRIDKSNYKEFEKTHPDLASEITKQIKQGVTDEFSLSYPPKGYYLFNTSGYDPSHFTFEKGFKFTEKDIDRANFLNKPVKVFENVEIPFKKGQLLRNRLGDTNIILANEDSNNKEEFDKIVDHELAHLRFDNLIDENEAVSKSAKTILSKLETLNVNNKKLVKDLLNRVDGSPSELLAIIDSEPKVKSFIESLYLSNDVDLIESVETIHHTMNTFVNENRTSEEYNDNLPFSAANLDIETLEQTSFKEDENYFNRVKKTWDLYQTNNKFKGYEIIQKGEHSFLVEKNYDKEKGFSDIAYQQLFQKYQRVEGKTLSNILNDNNRESLVKSEWDDLKLDTLSEHDLVLVRREKKEDGKIQVYMQYFPIMYVFPRERKFLVATGFTNQKGKNKGKATALPINYDDVIGFAKYSGNPITEIQLPASGAEYAKEIELDTQNLKKDFSIQTYSPNTHITVSLANTIKDRVKHATTVDNWVQGGDVVRVRWEKSEDYRNDEHKFNYYVKFYKVVAKHANAVSVAINKKNGSETTLVIPFHQIDRVAKSRESFDKEYKTKLKEVEITKGKETYTVFNPDEEGEIKKIEDRKEYLKKQGLDEKESEKEILSRMLPSDWIKYKVANRKGTLWGKIINVGEDSVTIVSVSKEDTNLEETTKNFIKIVSFKDIEWHYSSLDKENETFRNLYTYFNNLKETFNISSKAVTALNEGAVFPPAYRTITVSSLNEDYIDEKGNLMRYWKQLKPGDRVSQRFKKKNGEFGMTVVTVTRVDLQGNVYYANKSEFKTTKGDSFFRTNRFKLNPKDVVKFHLMGETDYHPSFTKDYRKSTSKEVEEAFKEFNEKLEAQKARNNKKDISLNQAIEFQSLEKAEAFKELMLEQQRPFTYVTKEVTEKNQKRKVYLKAWAKFSKGKAVKKSNGDYEADRLVTKLEAGYARTNNYLTIPIAANLLKEGDYIALKRDKQEFKLYIQDVYKYNRKEGEIGYSLTTLGKSKKGSLYHRQVYLYINLNGEVSAKIEQFGKNEKAKEITVAALGLKGGDLRKNKDLIRDRDNKTAAPKIRKTRASKGKIKAQDLATLTQIVDNINNLTEANASLVTKEEFKQAMINRGVYYVNAENVEKAFVDNEGNIVVNKELASTSDAMHEYYHFVMRSFEKVNPKAYQDLMSAAMEHELFEEKRALYSDYTDLEIAEEVFVGLAQATFESKKDPNWFDKFKTVINDFYIHFKNFIGKVFGYQPFKYARGRELFNMTLEELTQHFGKTDLRRLEKERVTLSNSITDLRKGEAIQKLKNNVYYDDNVPYLINSQGVRSKLFDRILPLSKDLEVALEIYAEIESDVFKQKIKDQKFQIQDGELPFNLIEKYFGNRRVRSSRLEAWKTTRDEAFEKFKTADIISFKEEEHEYSVNGSKIIGNSENLEKEGIITPYNEEDFKTNLINNTLDLVEKTQGTLTEETEEQIKSNIEQFVNQLSVIKEPGTLFHKAMQTFLEGYNKAYGKTDEDKISRSLDNAYEKLIESVDGVNWFIDTPQIRNNFETNARQLFEIIKMNSGENFKILPEQKLTYTDENGKITAAGTADIVILKANGKVDVYDFKSSYKNVSNWSNYKNEHVVAQQLSYRSFLNSMGLVVDNNFILPVSMDMNFNTGYIDSFEPMSLLNISSFLSTEDRIKIEDEINRIYPVSASKTTQAIESNIEVADFMQAYFNFDINPTRETTDETNKKQFSESYKFESAVLRLIDKHKNGRYTEKNPFGDKPISVKKELEKFKVKKGYSSIDNIPIADRIKIYKDTYLDLLFNYEKSKGNTYKAVVDWVNAQRVNVLSSRNVGTMAEINTKIIKNKDDIFNETFALKLEKYLYDSNWEVIESPELQDLNIVAFYHKRNKVWEFITLTDKDPSDYFQNGAQSTFQRVAAMRRKGSILGKFLPAHQLTEDIFESTYENYEAMKVMLFIINNPSLFKDTKIGKYNHVISTSSTTKDVGDQTINFNWFTLDEMLKQLKKVVSHPATKNVKTELGKKIEKFNVRIFDNVATTYLDEAFMHLDRLQSRMLDLSKFQRNNEERLLKGLKIEGTQTIEDFFKTRIHPKLSNLDEINYKILDEIVQELSFLIDAVERKLTVENSVNISEFLSLLRSARLEFAYQLPGAKNEVQKIGSLTNGYMFGKPDDLVEPSEKAVVSLVNQARFAIRNEVLEFAKGEHYDKVKALYTSKNMGTISSGLKHAVSGNFLRAFDNMFELDEKGMNNYRLRDPDEKAGDYDYLSRKQTALSMQERDYIRFFLKEVNAVRRANMTASQRKQFDDDTERHLDLPLQKASSSTKLQNEGIGAMLGEAYENIINPAQIFEDDMKFKRAQAERKYMPSVFDYLDTDIQARDVKIQQAKDDNNKAAFETNLELLLDSFILSNSKKKQFNKVLPIINDLRSHLLYQSMAYNQDTDKAVEQLELYLDSAVFSKRDRSSSKDIEVSKTIQGVTGATMQLTTMANLTFNVMSGLNQYVESNFLMMTKQLSERSNLNTPSVSDYAWAYRMVHADIKNGKTAITKLRELNRRYGINVDLSEHAKYLTNQNYGLANATQADALLPNSIPDYVTRMAILLAYMKKDGSWDAHTIKNDRLIYLPHKDKRFSKLFNSNGVMKDKSFFTTAQEMEQLTMYETLVKSLSSSEGVVDGKPIMGYDVKQVRNMKNEADTILGAFTKADKSAYTNFVGYSMLLQFQRYLGGTLYRHWFDGKGKRSDAQGRYKLIKKTKFNENTSRNELVLDKNNNPVYESVWQTDYHEGILNTFMYFINNTNLKNPKSFSSLLLEGWADLPEEVKRKRKENLKMFLAEMIIFILSNIGGYALLANAKETPGATTAALVLDRSTNNMMFGFISNVVSLDRNPVASINMANKIISNTFDSVVLLSSGEPIKAISKVSHNFNVTGTIADGVQYVLE